MRQRLKIGIVGDFNPDYPSHVATNEAINHAGNGLGIFAEVQWLPTIDLEKNSETLEQFHALLYHTLMNRYFSTGEKTVLAVTCIAVLTAAVRYSGLRWLFAYLAALNLVTFSMYFYDKRQAGKMQAVDGAQRLNAEGNPCFSHTYVPNKRSACRR